MSMIYECPNCHVPQKAGAMSCPNCGAEFDGAVPADAVVPQKPGVSAETSSTAAAASPPVPEPVPGKPDAPRLEEVRPPAESLPYQAPPYQPQPAYPQAQPSYATNSPVAQSATGGPPKALLIGLPIALILIAGLVIYFLNSSYGPETTQTPTPTTATAIPTPNLPIPAPASAGSPVYLKGGGGSSGSTSNGVTQWLVGRWQAKSTDFYQFNQNGTGFRGTIVGKQPKEAFLWVLAQNQLILYADKQEKLTVSAGPDGTSMFLRSADGHSIEYAHTKSTS